MDETWVSAYGFEGAYEVSSLGRVRSVDRMDAVGRKIRGRLLKNARIDKPGNARRGRYLRIRLTVGAVVNQVTVHVLVLSSFVGPRPEGMQACHNDGDLTNNAIENLRWDTCSANSQDKIRHGTIARGSRNGWSKLSEETVAVIKGANLGPTQLARMFGLSREHVQRIRNKNQWRHVAVTAWDRAMGARAAA